MSTAAGGGRTGRRPGSEDTRGRVLAAARELFAELGFERTSIRAIAVRAGVDPSLVHHYFGTKQRLFLASMEFPVDFDAMVPAILAAGPPDRLGERLVRAVLELWERDDVQPVIMAVIRSATTDPTAAAMLRAMLSNGPIPALAAASGRPDAGLRATLAGSQLIGLALARYVVLIEPLASMPAGEAARLVGPTIQAYLSGHVGAPDRDATSPPAG